MAAVQAQLNSESQLYRNSSLSWELKEFCIDIGVIYLTAWSKPITLGLRLLLSSLLNLYCFIICNATAVAQIKFIYKSFLTNRMSPKCFTENKGKKCKYTYIICTYALTHIHSQGSSSGHPANLNDSKMTALALSPLFSSSSFQPCCLSNNEHRHRNFVKCL